MEPTLNAQRSKPVTNRRSGVSAVPCHPGLQALVEGKQAWAEALDESAREQGFLGWHQRGYLPHHDVPGVTQFLTFRLADTMPASRRSEWAALLKIESGRKRRMELEAYLDRGAGACWLARPDLAALAEGALRHFDGQRYQLQAWVVMPNHVHVLVDIWETPLAVVLHSWKRQVAREANQLLRREGAFWEREYWDTLIRDEEQRRKAIGYVENNPVKATLVRDAKEWQWSSARFRDQYGRLTGDAPGGAPVGNRLAPRDNPPSRLQTGAPQTR